MKRILAFLFATLCVLGSVTVVSAVPIAEGESFTWCFDTTGYPQGASANGLAFGVVFSGDLLDSGETAGNVVTDEIGSLNLTAINFSGPLSAYTYVDPDSPTWTIDDDLYLTLTMISGSVNVQTTHLFHLLVDGIEIQKEVLGVRVAEPATMLLLGLGLVGLAGFRRKFRKG